MGFSDLIRRAENRVVPAASAVYRWAKPGPERLGSPAPAPAGADPVVLIAGMGNDHRFMDVWERSFAADGYRAFTFPDPGHGLGDVRTAARDLGSFVDDVLARTGAHRVDVVAYSAGITTARTWLTLGRGAAKTDALVNLDGSWAGDDDSQMLDNIRRVPLVGRALLGCVNQSEFDVQRGSALNAELNTHQAIPDGVRVTAVHRPVTRFADVPGAPTVLVRDVTAHLDVPRRSAAAYEAVRAAL